MRLSVFLRESESRFGEFFPVIGKWLFSFFIPNSNFINKSLILLYSFPPLSLTYLGNCNVLIFNTILKINNGWKRSFGLVFNNPEKTLTIYYFFK
mgnify:CR=1 FL=1